MVAPLCWHLGHSWIRPCRTWGSLALRHVGPVLPSHGRWSFGGNVISSLVTGSPCPEEKARHATSVHSSLTPQSPPLTSLLG